jgi:prolyl-tRNA editing enzyme YbaK/EbsC (Cys-tRNA(Pro) deacylase)
MDVSYPPAVKTVINVLEKSEIAYEVRILDAPARHANQAADLLTCPLGAIVKSLAFQREISGEILMVLVSGKNRADPRRLNQILGGKVNPAQPEIVLAKTGYPVGAVPPVCINMKYPVVMDEDLLAYERVWGSAGAVNILIGLTPEALQRLTHAQIANLKQI